MALSIEQARENVDNAIYEFVKAHGIDADNLDYSYINQELDDLVEFLA